MAVDDTQQWLNKARMEKLLLDCASKDKQAVRPDLIGASAMSAIAGPHVCIPRYLAFAAMPELEAVPLWEVSWGGGICTARFSRDESSG